MSNDSEAEPPYMEVAFGDFCIVAQGGSGETIADIKDIFVEEYEQAVEDYCKIFEEDEDVDRGWG